MSLDPDLAEASDRPDRPMHDDHSRVSSLLDSKFKIKSNMPPRPSPTAARRSLTCQAGSSSRRVRRLCPPGFDYENQVVKRLTCYHI